MLSILLLTILFVLIAEGSAYSVYGGFLSNESVNNYIEIYSPFELNQYSDGYIIGPKLFVEGRPIKDDIEIIKGGTFISKTPTSLFSRYYINNVGRVFIWSKGHKQIVELYKTIKK